MVEAINIEVGQVIVVSTGTYKVLGWFLDGNGKVNLLYGNRWHRHYRHEKLEVIDA